MSASSFKELSTIVDKCLTTAKNSDAFNSQSPEGATSHAVDIAAKQSGTSPLAMCVRMSATSRRVIAPWSRMALPSIVSRGCRYCMTSQISACSS
ncbi:hypothetical protein ACOMHN_067696 [Nucella lapillus]